MRIGPLNNLITIQVKTPGSNAVGDPVAGGSWSTFAEAYSSRTDKPGTEAIIDGEVVTIARSDYYTHHIAGLTSAMRILDNGVARNIVNVREVGLQRDLIIEVQSVARPS